MLSSSGCYIIAPHPEKNYTMRIIISNIGAPPYGVPKYFAKITQPALNKDNHKVQNSS